MSTRRMNRTLLLIALPCVVLLALLNVYPVLNAGWESLNNGNMIASHPFVGLRNYIDVLNPSAPSFVRTAQPGAFWPASLVTLIYAACGVVGGWVLGFALALFLRTRVPLAGLWRALLLLPWVIPNRVTAAGWVSLFFSHHSPGTLLLHDLGFGWLEFYDDPLAQVMLFAFRVWLSFPFMFLLMSSALASVDRSVYEAARADGANAWQIFTRITLPMTSRTTYIAWLLMAIMCVNDYPSIALLTGGGPHNATQTLIVLAWQNAGMADPGSIGGGIPDATAIGFLMTIVLVAVSLVLYRRIQRMGGGWTVDSASLGAGGAASGDPRGRWWRLLAVAAITFVLLYPLGPALSGTAYGGRVLPAILSNLKQAVHPATLAMLGRSSALTAITVVVCLAVAAPAGYAIARGRSRALSGVALLTFAVQSFPVLLLLWPMMVLFARLGLLQTLTAVQIVYIGMSLGFATWLFWSFFVTMPIDIEEAAWADGCSVFGAFLRVVIPNAIPAIVSTGMFVFVLSWGDWQVASVFLNLSAEPIVGLLTPIPTLSLGAPQSLLFFLPPLVVFLALSRYVSLGGVAASFSRR